MTATASGGSAAASRPNLRLVGTTESNGGEFGNVKIVGECRLNGDTKAETFKCTGSALIKGSLHSRSVKLTGDLRVDGEMRTGRSAITGEVNVSGNVTGERFRLVGQLAVEGDCELETLEGGGGFRIGGLLSADRLDWRLHGPCEAREIGGGAIAVKRSRIVKLKDLLLPSAYAGLTAASIEGDVVELEHTRADAVRGNRVVIGPGCEIGVVEYRHSLSVAKGAKVGQQIKT
ncbi:hypothetical protein [Cohnella laeviribosi]|uniref:hypothetical protein n=1 Tax=Cohnella laeviribosi TaxID=380174 RepID=UPI00037E8F9E|nr:hypothetical protein [Cohnella laeviribosi]